MAKHESPVPDSHLKLYEKLLESFPEVDQKGVKMPYTSVNGNMFSFMTETGVLAIRLSEVDRISFLKKFKTQLCERHGTVMKEYVEVPMRLLKKTAELRAYFGQSIEYARSLKAKATTRKKTSAAKNKVEKRTVKKKIAKQTTVKQQTVKKKSAKKAVKNKNSSKTSGRK